MPRLARITDAGTSFVTTVELNGQQVDVTSWTPEALAAIGVFEVVGAALPDYRTHDLSGAPKYQLVNGKIIESYELVAKSVAAVRQMVFNEIQAAYSLARSQPILWTNGADSFVINMALEFNADSPETVLNKATKTGELWEYTPTTVTLNPVLVASVNKAFTDYGVACDAALENAVGPKNEAGLIGGMLGLAETVDEAIGIEFEAPATGF